MNENEVNDKGKHILVLGTVAGRSGVQGCLGLQSKSLASKKKTTQQDLPNLKNMLVEEVEQLAGCLLCKHQDLSSHPQHPDIKPWKLDHEECSCNPSTGRQRQEAHPLSQSRQQVSFKSNESPGLKKSRGVGCGGASL